MASVLHVGISSPTEGVGPVPPDEVGPVFFHFGSFWDVFEYFTSPTRGVGLVFKKIMFDHFDIFFSSPSPTRGGGTGIFLYFSILDHFGMLKSNQRTVKFAAGPVQPPPVVLVNGKW